MNWTNKISPYAILVLAWLVLTTLQAQVEQQPDTLRFDPETGLPVEEETEPDTTPQFDPETGLPVKAEPEAPAPPQFDPETGKLIPPHTPFEAPLAAGEVGLEPMLENVIAAAEAEAVRSHDKGKNGCIGATGCLFTGIGLLATTAYVENDVSLGFEKIPTSLAAIYYRNLSPELQQVYEDTYKRKMKSLRRRSVYGTQLLIFGAIFGPIFIDLYL